MGLAEVHDLHQLRSSVAAVVASRRVLAWSYVFKFFQFDDDSRERELQLFETYQVRAGAVGLLCFDFGLFCVSPSGISNSKRANLLYRFWCH